ncbi:hypothetical protein KL935_004130 [Ogataea polymorpha]|nr:hypothetical protein KL908_004647 [Ogataea polymorpha]KAG7898531.1 hypothetical protein KL935_004130 [Ogataea polymorpha]KAG7914645.1 hypothetical protein KL927_004314 [Ogataea polymorpha]
MPTAYPHPQKHLGHAVNYLTGNHEYDIPKETVDGEIAQLRARLESKPSFNPGLTFDPEKHLIKDPSAKVLTLDDLKIKKTRVAPVCNFATTYQFPLLTQEAVDMILWEALRPEIVEKYGRLPNLAKSATRLDFHIGGHCSRWAPFTQALWHSPELREILERFTKVKMKPLFSAGHFNFSLAEKNATEPPSEELLRKYREQSNGDEVPSSLGMHYDSSTFALVIMAELDENTIGGETGIVTGDNKFVRVPDPKVGSATLIQGMVLKHVATKPVSNSNRVTAVAGFCVAGPEKLDNSLLTSVKPSILPRQNYNEFYNDWAQFRLTNLAEHILHYRDQLKNVEQFDQKDFIAHCQEMESYLHKCWDEMEEHYNPPYPPKEFRITYDEL